MIRADTRPPFWWGIITVAALASALFLVSTKANADTRIGAHVGSYHNEGDFNNFNPGLYVYHNGWTAGTYYNSERKQSVYAGYTFEGEVIGNLKWGATLGLITGYSRARVMPMIVPSVSHPVGAGFSARVSFVPKIEKGGSAAVHLSIEKAF